ncbi:TPA: helix-turn-helix transcriptional regulator [Pasteurella multocida]|nr:helix-turn-helix transcriptional regulator [Pasteurella multocida]HDR0675368.1 helix-turn-helix transcriptional regulator [Pasteurella multocida]HDR0677799.1 helix-turn-helix transcriptional regulator [Pasteurella multocida]HDR0679925.1 helix-turn-helix transcriptional regulator [Pasteurella multocida]HDR0681862.1 helix-turn-helix transcriptional regulator [Pasteurella multocida]
MQLDQFLAERNLTQVDFAKSVNKTQGFISHYLTGRHKLSAATTLEWARATDYTVTPHELSPHLYPNPKDGMPVSP